MSNVTPIEKHSVRAQAAAEVAHEDLQKNVAEMKRLMRQRLEAEKVLKGIDRQIEDLERQIADGTR